MRIPDFINAIPEMDIRLQRTLMNIHNHYGYEVEEVVKYEFTKQHNTGFRTWNKFVEMRRKFFNEKTEKP
jgi:hypothetical protein